MRFELTRESQRSFRQGLDRIAKLARKRIGDLLRQTAVFYAQGARKRTPGPWYASLKKTMRQRPVRKLTKAEAKIASEVKRRPVAYAVKVWSGSGGVKTEGELYTQTKDSPLRVIKYRGAAQLSWSGMLKKLFKNEATPGTANAGDFANVLANGATVRRHLEGLNRETITTENKLGYIARLRPGIAAESLLAAENRIAAIYTKKLGPELAAEWSKS